MGAQFSNDMARLLRDEKSIGKPWNWLCRQSEQQAVTVGHMVAAPNTANHGFAEGQIWIWLGPGTILLNYFWEAHSGNPMQNLQIITCMIPCGRTTRLLQHPGPPAQQSPSLFCTLDHQSSLPPLPQRMHRYRGRAREREGGGHSVNLIGELTYIRHDI